MFLLFCCVRIFRTSNNKYIQCSCSRIPPPTMGYKQRFPLMRKSRCDHILGSASLTLCQRTLGREKKEVPLFSLLPKAAKVFDCPSIPQKEYSSLRCPESVFELLSF
nr:hypothetical protein MarQu_413 [Marseillevirus sp.]